MSLAKMSLYTLGTMLPANGLSLTKQPAEEFVRANPRVVDRSSDFAAEMVKATPALSAIFFRYLGTQPEKQQIVSLFWVLARTESIKNDSGLDVRDGRDGGTATADGDGPHVEDDDDAEQSAQESERCRIDHHAELEVVNQLVPSPARIAVPETGPSDRTTRRMP